MGFNWTCVGFEFIGVIEFKCYLYFMNGLVIVLFSGLCLVPEDMEIAGSPSVFGESTVLEFAAKSSPSISCSLATTTSFSSESLTISCPFAGFLTFVVENWKALRDFFPLSPTLTVLNILFLTSTEVSGVAKCTPLFRFMFILKLALTPSLGDGKLYSGNFLVFMLDYCFFSLVADSSILTLIASFIPLFILSDGEIMTGLKPSSAAALV